MRTKYKTLNSNHNLIRQHGFTLVELSIVLVILGLLVGGVLSGQALIRASELRAVATERDRYVTALNAFKDKYFALPGDMKNAFAFWGTDCGTDTTDGSTGCNGNGDGLVQSGSPESEFVKAWEHLSRAGLIEGSFDGTGVPSGAQNVVTISNTNVPASRFPNAYWSIGVSPCEGCGYGMPSYAAGQSTLLALGSFDTPDVSDPEWLYPLKAMTNSEVWNIDTKTDDGRSETGTMRGGNAEGVCDDDGGNDPYRLSTQADATGQCVIVFKL